MGGKVVAILSPSEGLFSGSSFYSLQLLSGQAFPLHPSEGMEMPAAFRSGERYPGWGALPSSPVQGGLPIPGPGLGVSLPPLPTVGLNPPPDPPNMGVLPFPPPQCSPNPPPSQRQ